MYEEKGHRLSKEVTWPNFSIINYSISMTNFLTYLWLVSWPI